MDFFALRDEINTDSLTRGYSGMTDAEVADDLNTIYRTRVRTTMSGDEIFSATDSTEFTGLTDHERVLWVSFCGKDNIDPSNATNIAFLDYIFGGSSTTKSTLATLRTENISRAEELGFGFIKEANVAYARTL
jgi:hypothetical protein